MIANTVWGALRGLETFSQLIVFNYTTLYYTAYEATITDMPRFQHRGIMLDTSRHFQTLPAIKRLLDAMSYAKFNVIFIFFLFVCPFVAQSLYFSLCVCVCVCVLFCFYFANLRNVIKIKKKKKLKTLHWHMVDAEAFPFQSMKSNKNHKTIFFLCFVFSICDWFFFVCVFLVFGGSSVRGTQQQTEH